MKTIVICSGGFDSVSLAHKIAAEHDLFGLLSLASGAIITIWPRSNATSTPRLTIAT